MILVYMCFMSKRLHFYRPKFTRKSLMLTARNVGYMAKVGLPSFIGEGAISVMIVTGNYMFTPRLHEDGVAAYSVCCYLFPLVFMFGNAIVQSSLPIISYNYGQSNDARIEKTLRLSLVMAFVLGLLMTLGGIFCATPDGVALLAARFFCLEHLLHGRTPAVLHQLCLLHHQRGGNRLLAGVWNNSRAATFFMLLRSCLLLIPAFDALAALYRQQWTVACRARVGAAHHGGGRYVDEDES